MPLSAAQHDRMMDRVNFIASLIPVSLPPDCAAAITDVVIDVDNGPTARYKLVTEDGIKLDMDIQPHHLIAASSEDTMTAVDVLCRQVAHQVRAFRDNKEEESDADR